MVDENLPMSYQPLVSVVMPAYNASEFIAEAIKSVLSQTYQHLELIVIDDGSVDNTGEIVSEFVEKYKPTIRYQYQDNSGRPACARNKGIILARGEWIAFLDSDDYWINGHLQQLIEKAKIDKEVALVYGSKIWVDQNGNEYPPEYQPRYEMPEGWIFAEMFKNNLMCTSSLLVKRSKLFDVDLFNESKSLKVAEDYDLCLKISATSKVASLPELKYYYRRHNTNTTLDNSKRARGLITAVDNAANLVINGKVAKENDLQDVDIRKRIVELYEHAVLTTYYDNNYLEMRRFVVEGIWRGIITRKIIEKVILSLLPRKVVAIIKNMVRAK
ncbi:glycosyltransferase [Oryzomonas japonica]|uniref:Glycosyltransferase n=1 Tax=Oryzomonas japonica TaxID=2603858 RepID=A0A7J4ZSV3_9BACT|nr:glycosyltransferase [Oryzomonas japonica]KAB0666491.1 glycosyltransferase [Oryzomonas japonica]